MAQLDLSFLCSFCRSSFPPSLPPSFHSSLLPPPPSCKFTLFLGSSAEHYMSFSPYITSEPCIQLHLSNEYTYIEFLSHSPGSCLLHASFFLTPCYVSNPFPFLNYDGFSPDLIIVMSVTTRRGDSGGLFWVLVVWLMIYSSKEL